LPKDGKLNYYDFQLFMKRLRKHYKTENVGFFMCGEYGETTQRPHYHACLFGMDFPDKILERETERGDQCYSSETLDQIWGKGHTEIGSVTQQSAGYVARYILKKQDKNALQGFQKMSRKYAIGKRFVELYWRDIFVHASGSIILSDGTKTKVPRYYEKWLQKHHPEQWLCYTTETKPENTKRLTEKAEREHAIYRSEVEKRLDTNKTLHDFKTPLARKREILKEKLKQLKRNFL